MVGYWKGPGYVLMASAELGGRDTTLSLFPRLRPMESGAERLGSAESEESSCDRVKKSSSAS